MPPAAPAALDPAELARLEGDVAAAAPPPPPEPPPPPPPGSAPQPELHDARTEPPPGGGAPGPEPGPTPEDLEALLGGIRFTEEELRDLFEFVFAIIALRRAIRDPVTRKLVWELDPEESRRIAKWATKVANRREWLRKLAEYFPEIMLAVTLLWAGWRRHAREQEILAAEKQREAHTP